MTKEFVVLGFDSRELAEEARSLGAELVQPMRLSQAGAASGAVAGTVLGMLLLEPVLFAAVGAAAGAAGGGLSALGLNQWFLALRPLAPRVLNTTLDPAAEQRLLAAFTDTAALEEAERWNPPTS